MFEDATVLHLLRISSDHPPILLSTSRKGPKRKKQFKVEFHWTDHPQFLHLIENNWKSLSGSVTNKLELLGKLLTKWSNNTFGNIHRELEVERQKLSDLQSRAHITDIREEERIILDNIEVLMKRERMFWEQRNKSIWIPSNDKNTHIFHLSVLHRRNKNRIITLKNECGEWISDHEKIRDLLVSHFQQVFTADNSVSPNLFSLDNSNALSESECRLLGVVPSAKEIISVIKHMKPKPGTRWLSCSILQEELAYHW